MPEVLGLPALDSLNAYTVPYVNQTASSNVICSVVIAVVFFTSFPNNFHSPCFMLLCVFTEIGLILASDLWRKTDYLTDG